MLTNKTSIWVIVEFIFIGLSVINAIVNTGLWRYLSILFGAIWILLLLSDLNRVSRQLFMKEHEFAFLVGDKLSLLSIAFEEYHKYYNNREMRDYTVIMAKMINSLSYEPFGVGGLMILKDNADDFLKVYKDITLKGIISHSPLVEKKEAE
ncbi:MAG: hypothetical protein QXL94_01630 [Candidatus Parvarchaeum sp.]